VTHANISQDIQISTGAIPGDDQALGFDGAGTVTKVGQNVHSFRVGDKVAFTDTGAFANRARTTYKRVHRVPDGMALEVC
jgi:NADPH:quinone reductase-like Zn-dependent oxidoreductase